jgi:hypothetical protein
MKYINSIKASIVALIVFCILTFVVSGSGPSESIKIILTVSTFLFAILVGFFISRLNSRYDKILEFTAVEDGYWLAIYQNAKLIDATLAKNVRDLIDKYYIIAYDFEPGECYKFNSKYFLAVYQQFHKVAREGTKFMKVLNDSMNMLANIEINRKKSSILISEKLTKGQWAVLLSLAAIILSCLFSLKEQAFHSQVVTVLLSTILVMVLFMLRDLQNLIIMGKLSVEESGQEIFDYLGKPRYFNKKWKDKGISKIPSNGKKFRLGLHKPGEEVDIKTMTENDL